mgnify:CR=1 FL=1
MDRGMEAWHVVFPRYTQYMCAFVVRLDQHLRPTGPFTPLTVRLAIQPRYTPPLGLRAGPRRRSSAGRRRRLKFFQPNVTHMCELLVHWLCYGYILGPSPVLPILCTALPSTVYDHEAAEGVRQRASLLPPALAINDPVGDTATPRTAPA